ncbi:MAG: anthranilate synthase component I family protein, partial [Bacteroidota bacterium]
LGARCSTCSKCLFAQTKAFEQVLHLAPSQQGYPHGTFIRGLACGSLNQVQAKAGEGFEALSRAVSAQPDWWFGHLGYDLKNEREQLRSQNPRQQAFPDLAFFRPAHWLYVEKEQLVVESVENPSLLLDAILSTPLPSAPTALPPLEPHITKEAYLATVERLRQHIEEGDVYEINFCQEFSASVAGLDMPSLFLSLQKHSPTPFSAYYRWQDQWMAGASPERFLKRQGWQLISQPIKGTAPRHTDPVLDEQLKLGLLDSEKERAENLMIVDLVRNDLARSCEAGSITVEELFGLYSFPQVHQMISTVTGTLKAGVSGVEAIARAFPMGSMTGAPKIKVMELIEKYEQSRRGLFSGAVGYFTPSGDFDFNVVIRSLFYNSHTQRLSYQVGSAITYDAIPEQEYQECMLKAEAMQRALGLSAQNASPTVR